MNFLHAAFAATWIIHIGYLCTVAARYRKARKRMDELQK